VYSAAKLLRPETKEGTCAVTARPSKAKARQRQGKGKAKAKQAQTNSSQAWHSTAHSADGQTSSDNASGKPDKKKEKRVVRREG